MPSWKLQVAGTRSQSIHNNYSIIIIIIIIIIIVIIIIFIIIIIIIIYIYFLIIIIIVIIIVFLSLQVISTRVGGVPEVLPEDMIRLVEPNVAGWNKV